MKDIETKSLFSCENSLISPLLSEKYPWQILPKIKTFIEDLIKNTPQGFKEISKNVLVGKYRATLFVGCVNGL